MYITIKGRIDGFGAQYQGMLSAIAYCYYHNHMYVHTPFTYLDHGTNVQKANQWIGFPTEKAPVGTIEKTSLEEVHDSETPSIYYTEDVLQYIRHFYFRNKPTKDIDIAIHIRRGDVSKRENTNRYIENGLYREVIVRLKKKYPAYTIAVFSEGTYSDFLDLGLEKNCFHLNEDLFDTFHSLVSAKVLVTGFSSFSYCAALLNTNQIYHHDQFWHKKLDHWNKISELLE